MPAACHVGHNAQCPACGHGNDCCPHSVSGPAVGGASNVFIHGQPAVRVGDPGVHSSCCGANSWVAAGGSGTVFINGIASVRMGDATTHCGGSGTMVEGSESVGFG